MSDPRAKGLPPNWILKESRHYPGKFYYANVKTGKTCWELPESNVEGKAESTNGPFPLGKNSLKTKHAWTEVSKPGCNESDSGRKRDQAKKTSAPMVPRVILNAKRKIAHAETLKTESSEQYKTPKKLNSSAESGAHINLESSSSKKQNKDEPIKARRKKKQNKDKSNQPVNESPGRSQSKCDKRNHQEISTSKRKSDTSCEFSLVPCEGSDVQSDSPKLKSPSQIKGLPTLGERTLYKAELFGANTVKKTTPSPSLGTSKTISVPKSGNRLQGEGRSERPKKSASRVSADLHTAHKAKPYDKRSLSKKAKPTPSVPHSWKPEKADITQGQATCTRSSIPCQSPSTDHTAKKTTSSSLNTSGHGSGNKSSRDIFASPENVVHPVRSDRQSSQDIFASPENVVRTARSDRQSSQDIFASPENVVHPVRSEPQPGPSTDAMEIDPVHNSGFEGDTRLGLNKVRAALIDHKTDVIGNLTEWMVQTGSTANRPPGDSTEALENALYVVIDTNIILGQLKYVDELKDEKFEELGRPYLVIPWVVLQELDGLKNAKMISDNISLALNVQLLARNSVQYLNHCLQAHHPRIIGQTPAESCEAISNLPIECNDDRILQCVLQWQQKYPKATIVLLTEDTNLQNKALVMHLRAYNAKSLTERLSGKSSPKKEEVGEDLATTKRKKAKQLADDVLCEVKSQLRSPLGVVMETEMKSAYGNLWSEIVYRKPPWTLKDLLDCFNKHWIAVFGMIFPRHCQESLKVLRENYRLGEGYGLNVKSASTVLSEALQFCEAIVAHTSYGGIFTDPLVRIKDLLKICRDVSKGTREAADLATLEGHHHDDCASMDSIQTSPDVNGNSDSNRSERLIQAMQFKFQILWENILYCKECLESFLQSADAGRDVTRRKEYVDFLGRLVRCLSTLDAAYLRVVCLGIEELVHHPQAFSDLAAALDSLAVQTRIQPWECVIPEALLLFCGTAHSRPLLDNGYTQLRDFLGGLHNCWLTLSPQEKATLNV